MSGNKLKFAAKTVLSLIILSLAISGGVSAQTETYELDNGMELILMENHSSPMIACIIFVKSGSKYELEYENGLTHFLEHLLFDGTINKSREELDRSIRDLGGYINAFTRKELTAYLVLMPQQHINYGLTVQADMLFNSIFPEDELIKERKVVIEEIRQSVDSPGSVAEEFFTLNAYDGTPYSRPVLGYEAFIENIPREAIIDYWKRSYRPSNMTALVIGDFETSTMKKTIADIFGTIADTKQNSTDSDPIKWQATHLSGQIVFDTVANIRSTHVNFSIDAPHFTDSTHLPFDLLTQYLSIKSVSPLLKALTEGPSPLATDVSVGLVTYSELSRLELWIDTDNPDNATAIISTVVDQLKAASSLAADPEIIQGIKTTVKCDDIYYSEKLHFYSFIIAPLMMSAGWDFVQHYPERLQQVSWDQCRDAAREWLSQPNYVVTVIKPIGKSGKTGFKPGSMTAEDVIAHFDTAVFADYDLSQGIDLTYPKTDSIGFELIDHAQYHREVLPNGLTVIIKSSSDSRVFAMNVLGKNRTACEPQGKEGITDFVNRCIAKGTITRNSKELSRDLSRIGANVTLYDNPWIPMDDRYTTRQFSFMKFETIEEYAEKGFYLFSEILCYPSFDSQDVAGVRRSLFAILGRNAASPRKTARNLFYEKLFEGRNYSRPISGTLASITSITPADLREHHTRFYSPENTILCICTSRPTETVMQWVNRIYGRMTPAGFTATEITPPEPVLEIQTAHTDLESEQISLYIGGILPGATDDDAIAIKVATSILSSRLYLNLREKQGLAYSVGAGSVLDKDFGWTYSVIGTASENYQQALDGILLETEKLKLDGPTRSEIVLACNQLWGSLIRAKLSRINQAYYLAVDEYLERPLGYDQEYLKALSQVTADSVRRVMTRYFRTDKYVLTSAGRKP